MNKKVIHSVFEKIVRDFPDQVAIDTGQTNITYIQLNKYANRLSNVLSDIFQKKGTIVNVVGNASIELIGAMLSVFKSGGIYLPVDIKFSEKRLRQIFSDTSDGVIILTEDVKDQFLSIVDALDIVIETLIVLGNNQTIRIFRLSEDILTPIMLDESESWEDDPLLQVDGDTENYIFYTSGSTGEGKAIVGLNASLSHFIHWEIKEFNIDHTCRVSQLTQITFDASLRDIFVALISGGTLYIPPQNVRSSGTELLKWSFENKITIIHCVPSLFRLLTKELTVAPNLNEYLIYLKYILMAGELIYIKDIINWRNVVDAKIQLVNLYGATETTLIKTFYRIGDLDNNPSNIIPVGKPISNTIIALIKDNRICKDGEIGEIFIKTPFMTNGYYKNPELSSKSFVQNPLVSDVKDIVYKTGDLGRILPSGDIEVLGRLDSQVKINGVRVELLEVEKAILSFNNVTGVVVNVHKGADDFSSLIAYYTGIEIEQEEFRTALSKLLNPQLLPSYICHIAEFPLNVNGKIDKKALRLPDEIIMGGSGFHSPVGNVEISLAQIWGEILGYKKISRDISFFHIGGHSLRAIRLISMIQKRFSVNLKIVDVFTNPTIQSLGLLIENSLINHFENIDPVPESDSYPLSSAQRRLWILDQFEEGNIAYNMPGVYVFEGSLDRNSLDYAFAELIGRHESLRTIFREGADGDIRQYIQSPQ
ncbi:amino acid adenylation domain-containing protein, partial [Mucilaginibacter lappiensis]